MERESTALRSCLIGLTALIALSGCTLKSYRFQEQDGSNVGDGAQGDVNVPLDGTMADALNGTDSEAGCDACGGTMAPRLIAPISTATMSSPYPRLEWTAVTGAANYVVQFCGQRVCASVTAATTVSTTQLDITSAMPTFASPGLHYWRVGSLAAGETTPGANAWSNVWEYFARAAPASGPPQRTVSYSLVGDSDEDGLADIMVCSVESLGDDAGTNSTIRIRWGSAGSGSSGQSLNLPGPSGGVFVAFLIPSGDINGDGTGDTIVDAVTSQGGSIVFSATLMMGSVTRNITSTTTPLPALPVSTSVTAPVGDLDRDGYADLLALSSNGHVAYIMFGGASGPGATSADIVAVAAPPGCASFGTDLTAAHSDINGDGHTEFNIACPETHQLYTFSTMGSTRTVQSVAFAFNENNLGGSSLDHNGDGYSDLMYLGSDGMLHILDGGPTGLTANGTLAAPPALGTEFRGIATAGDANGDGFDDLAVMLNSSGSQNTIAMLRGASDGTVRFFPHTDSRGHDVGRVGTGADFDGDGLSDTPIVTDDGFGNLNIGVFPGSTVDGLGPYSNELTWRPASLIESLVMLSAI